MEYKIMPDIREKEKIVGGHFTITQTIFLALSVVAGGGSALFIYQSLHSIPFALTVGAILAIPFLPFAFIKIESMGDKELFFYLLILLRYSHSQKVYVNMNENKRNRILGVNTDEEEKR